MCYAMIIIKYKSTGQLHDVETIKVDSQEELTLRDEELTNNPQVESFTVYHYAYKRSRIESWETHVHDLSIIP